MSELKKPDVQLKNIIKAQIRYCMEEENMGIIGILSLIFGVLGLLFSPFYIGVIPCIIALVLGIIGLTDFLSEKWPSVTGLLSSILGIVLFAYTLVSDLDANRLVIFYAKGDIVYLSNYDEIAEAVDSMQTVVPAITDIETSGSASVNVETAVPVDTENAAADYNMPVPTTVEMLEPQSSDMPITQTDHNSIEVHITDTGEKYHSSGCQYLRNSDHMVTLEQAKALGLEPCSKCNPPN